MQEQLATQREDNVPIACLLDAGSLRERMDWIANLNMRVLKSVRHDDLRLELKYTASAIHDVRKLVTQEQQCCPFLTFDLSLSLRSVTLTITAPEAARGAAEFLFEPLQAKRMPATACGCGPSCGS